MPHQDSSLYQLISKSILLGLIADHSRNILSRFCFSCAIYFLLTISLSINKSQARLYYVTFSRDIMEYTKKDLLNAEWNYFFTNFLGTIKHTANLKYYGPFIYDIHMKDEKLKDLEISHVFADSVISKQ